jgi:hypothetical protein
VQPGKPKTTGLKALHLTIYKVHQVVAITLLAIAGLRKILQRWPIGKQRLQDEESRTVRPSSSRQPLVMPEEHLRNVENTSASEDIIDLAPCKDGGTPVQEIQERIFQRDSPVNRPEFTLVHPFSHSPWACVRRVPNSMLNIVLLGDGGVGKSALIQTVRYARFQSIPLTFTGAER